MSRCEICDRLVSAVNKKGLCSRCDDEIRSAKRIKPAMSPEDEENMNECMGRAIRYGIGTTKADNFQRKLGEI